MKVVRTHFSLLLQQALVPIDVFDKTNLEIGLFGLSTVILEEWGSGMPCQVSIFMSVFLPAS